jgi:hypothetical protein
MRWHKTSPYSIAAVEADYAVSRAQVIDDMSGELVDRYSAWVGPDLLAQPRETARPAQLLGIRRSAAEAKALCETHAAAAGAAA